MNIVFYQSDSEAGTALEDVANWSTEAGTGNVSVTFPDSVGNSSLFFPLPADFIKLREIRDELGGKIDKFDIRRANDARCVVAGNYPTIVFDYVADIDDPTQYDPLFVAALVTLLASKLARAITGSDQLETTLRQTYLTVDLPSARCADGHDSQSNENHPLREILDGALTGQRADFFPELD
jgi:hypothetical protein